MILVIDTSSARSALAIVDSNRVQVELVAPSGRDFDVAREVQRILPDPSRLGGVLVALGPGSFTGLRQGIAFGVGLAMSRQVPLLGIGSLELAAARSASVALAVIDAGRGRAYYLAPDGTRGVAELADLPGPWPLVGWLKSPHPRLLPEAQLRSFGQAALLVKEAARRVGYGTVKADYMQEFGRLN